MQDHREFKNPPIKEAIIDIQVSAPNLGVNELNLADLMEKEGFSGFKPIFSQEFKLKVENGKFIPDGELDRALIGFRYDDEDQGYVAQFRLDSFTFSKLGDYKGWDEFKEKALKAWAVYRDIIGNFKFNRLAVRFINILVLPRDGTGKLDLEHYLVNSPRVPKALPDMIVGFFSKIDVKVDDPKCVAVITQAPSQAPRQEGDDGISIALDIDVFGTEVVGYSDKEAWEFIERLRNVKNTAFLGSITDQTKELID